MYTLLKNGEPTIACYNNEETAKEFIKQYDKEYNKKFINAEKEIEAIFDIYDLNYWNSTHKYIFQHLVDTDFVEYEDVEEYMKIKNKIDELKAKKITLTIRKDDKNELYRNKYI